MCEDIAALTDATYLCSEFVMNDRKLLEPNRDSRAQRINDAAIKHIRSELSTTSEEWRRLGDRLSIEISEISSERLIEGSEGLIDHAMDVVEICERAIELANGDPTRAEWAFHLASDDLIQDLCGHLDDENVPDNLRAWVFKPTDADLARPVAEGLDVEYLSRAVDAVVALTRVYNLEPSGHYRAEVKALMKEYVYCSELAFPELEFNTHTSIVIEAIERLVEYTGLTVEHIHEHGVILADGTHWLYTSNSYPLGTKHIVCRRNLELEQS